MSRQIVVRDSKSIERPWGKSNPFRGANHIEDATAFIADHPVGTQLSQEEFDGWAQGRGHYKVPTRVAKKSDAWVAHVRRRNYLRSCINKAAAHDRMSEPYVIESTGPGSLVVRSPHVAIVNDDTLQKVESLTKTRLRKLAYLMQSSDWTVLPPHYKVLTETMHMDITMFKEMVSLNAHHLSAKFETLENNLRRSVESGEVVTTNGGILGIIDSTKEKKRAK